MNTGFLKEREVNLKGRQQVEALGEIDANFENIRAAWMQAVTRRNYAAIDAMINGLSMFIVLRARFADGEELFEFAREKLAPQPGEEPHPVWGRVLSRYASKGTTQPETRIEQALAIAEQHKQRLEIAHCYFELGQVLKWQRRDFTTALNHYEKALTIFQEIGDRSGIASTFGEIGGAYANLGQIDEFERYTEQSLAIRREMGERFGEALALGSLCEIALAKGDFDKAEQLGRESLALYRELGNRWGLSEGRSVMGVAFSVIMHGGPDLDEIEKLIEESYTAAKDYRHSVGMGRALMLKGYLVARHGQYLIAKRLGTEGKSTAPDDPFQWVLGSGLLAYAEAGMGNYPASVREIYPAIQMSLMLHPPLAQRFLGIVALYYWYAKQDAERAVELYSIAFSSEDSAALTLSQWALYARLKDDLLRELGDEAYNAAYKRGKLLDLETVVQELLDEFGEDD